MTLPWVGRSSRLDRSCAKLRVNSLLDEIVKVFGPSMIASHSTIQSHVLRFITHDALKDTVGSKSTHESRVVVRHPSSLGLLSGTAGNCFEPNKRRVAIKLKLLGV